MNDTYIGVATRFVQNRTCLFFGSGFERGF
jgi:hypothetical protein